MLVYVTLQCHFDCVALHWFNACAAHFFLLCWDDSNIQKHLYFLSAHCSKRLFYQNALYHHISVTPWNAFNKHKILITSKFIAFLDMTRQVLFLVSSISVSPADSQSGCKWRIIYNLQIIDFNFKGYDVITKINAYICLPMHLFALFFHTLEICKQYTKYWSLPISYACY